jgi:hypothetical protein
LRANRINNCKLNASPSAAAIAVCVRASAPCAKTIPMPCVRLTLCGFQLNPRPSILSCKFLKDRRREIFAVAREERCACVCNNQRMTEFSAARSAHVVQRHSKNYHFAHKKVAADGFFTRSRPPHTTHTHLICARENNTNGVSSEVAGRMSSCLSCIT